MLDKVNEELFFCNLCNSYVWSEDLEDSGHWVYDAGSKWFCTLDDVED